jgi:quercetin dioxygenase-like cupin family protein
MKRLRKRVLAAIGIAAIGALVATALIVVPALATPPSGVTATLLAKGSFEEFDAKVKTGDWRSRLKANGPSDLEVLEVRIAPGGTFGWHSHPGPSMVIVKSGTATFYLGDDKKCTPHVVQAGQGFVDHGGDVHTVRNEGSVELVNLVTSLIPAGAARRIDEPSPGNRPF